MMNAARGAAARWQGCRGPEPPVLLVAQIEPFTLGILDGIIEPGREPVLAAVDRPGEAKPGLSNDRAERVVGQDIGPRSRGGSVGL
ncbi:hypothetical protein BF95_09090 [Sphingobium sp. Ant17]|nr:hypothetical protein BF95_09090 [Sphingobium sp. Ant17]